MNNFDIAVAVVWAWAILNLLFFPYVGLFLAYGMFQAWDYYCEFRLKQERNR